jgi:transposase
MKIIRSTTCSLKFATAAKRQQLRTVLREYGRLCNWFIDKFWSACPSKGELLKNVLNEPDSWLSARLRKVCAREAIDMIQASRKKTERDRKKLTTKADKARGQKADSLRQRASSLEAVKPTHRGDRMHVSSTIADLQPVRAAEEFDAWLHLASLGDKMVLDLPIRFHRHFHKWEARGRRLNSYIITAKSVQFCFEIETGEKKTGRRAVGIDTGVNALATLSTGEQAGLDIREAVDRVNRCRQGSLGQRRARRALRQRMDEVARDITSSDGIDLIVVEKLSNLNHKSKERRRLSKTIRRVIGSWVWRYWLDRVKMGCEENRVSFRSVPAYNTSITCRECGFTDKRNRQGEMFLCLNCSHRDNADINASMNILDRFLTGPYGAGFKPVESAILE